MTTVDDSGPFAGPLGPALVRLVVPMLLGMVMIALVGIVDAYFIGMLGIEALAAFGLCYPAVMILHALMFGLASGITASMARARGARRGAALGPEERLRVRVALTLAFGLGAALAALGALLGPLAFHAVAAPAIADLAMQYYGPFLLSVVCLALPMSSTACMRGFGETRSSALAMTLASVFNAGLDPLFMFGWGPIPAFGMAGASISTVVAYLIGGSYAVVLLRRTLRDAGRGAAEGLRATAVVADVAAVGLPAMVTQALGPVANAIITALFAAYGVEALAALGIMQRVDMLIVIVAVATGAGLMPMVGQMAGAGDMARVAAALRLARRSMVVWAVGVGVVLNLLSEPLARIFTDEAGVVDLVALALLFAPLGYVGGGLNITTMSCFNAVGRALMATKLAALFSLLLLPLGGVVGSHFFGVAGIFGGVGCASLLAAAVGTHWMYLADLVPERAASVVGAG